MVVLSEAGLGGIKYQKNNLTRLVGHSTRSLGRKYINYCPLIRDLALINI